MTARHKLLFRFSTVRTSSLASILLRFSSIFVAIFCAVSSSQGNTAGYTKMASGDLEFGVWYPTDAPAVVQRLGPFETAYAKNAVPSGKGREIILFSHGNGGRYRNHYLTAQMLANQGYVVVAPSHQADYLVGGPQTSGALVHRLMELEKALAVLHADSVFSQILAKTPVHGIGYSLGSATLLLASGLGFDRKVINSHCETHKNKDARFCNPPGRRIEFFRKSVSVPNTPDRFVRDGIITGKLVLIAPVAQGVVAEKGGVTAQSVTIIAITGDKIAKPRFHAQYLRDILSSLTEVKYREHSGHHFAFIAPFPKWLTDQEDIPVANDPEGFSRIDFLNLVNTDILSVFRKP